MRYHSNWNGVDQLPQLRTTWVGQMPVRLTQLIDTVAATVVTLWHSTEWKKVKSSWRSQQHLNEIVSGRSTTLLLLIARKGDLQKWSKQRKEKWSKKAIAAVLESQCWWLNWPPKKLWPLVAKPTDSFSLGDEFADELSCHQVGTGGHRQQVIKLGPGGQLAYQLWQPELQNVNNNKNLQTNSGRPRQTQSCEMSKSRPNQTQTQSWKKRKQVAKKLWLPPWSNPELQDVTGLVDISKHLKSRLVPRVSDVFADQGIWSFSCF